MTVIKAREAGRILKRLSTVDLADHLAEAKEIINAARRRASQIVRDAEEEAERSHAGAKESGYEAGYKQGYEEGTRCGRQAAHSESIERFEQEQAHVVEAIQGAVAGIDAIKQDLRIAAENDVLDFAVQVATKLTFAIGRLHREAAVENLKRALEQVAAKTDLTVRVHPDDMTAIETFADTVLKQVDASQAVEIVADDSLAPGGCEVIAGRTSVDATLETQVEEIVALLLGRKIRDA